MPKKTKKPIPVEDPATKRVKDLGVQQRPDPDALGKVSFRFDCIDEESTWALKNITSEHLSDLLTFLKSTANSKISDMQKNGTTFVRYTDLTAMAPAAKKRLTEHYKEKKDIHRFRLNGKQRLYGFLDDAKFSIVWWDPEHTVWPTEKKNT